MSAAALMSLLALICVPGVLPRLVSFRCRLVKKSVPRRSSGGPDVTRAGAVIRKALSTRYLSVGPGAGPGGGPGARADPGAGPGETPRPLAASGGAVGARSVPRQRRPVT